MLLTMRSILLTTWSIIQAGRSPWWEGLWVIPRERRRLGGHCSARRRPCRSAGSWAQRAAVTAPPAAASRAWTVTAVTTAVSAHIRREVPARETPELVRGNRGRL